jgi:hypothetical protein
LPLGWLDHAKLPDVKKSAMEPPSNLCPTAQLVTIRTVSKYRQLSNASRTFDISSLVSSLSRRILTVLTRINFGSFLPEQMLR